MYLAVASRPEDACKSSFFSDDTGTLAHLAVKDALRSFYQALFDMYEIRSVNLL
jgi:hypothetical protein